MQRTNLVFWNHPAGQMPRVIDGVMIDDAGVQRGLYSGETLDELAQRYPEPKVTTIDHYMAVHNAALRTDPRETTEEAYFEALDCLPPLDWTRAKGVESFKMEERFSANMTTIYAKHAGRYWSFMDCDDLSADEIADKILACEVEVLATPAP